MDPTLGGGDALYAHFGLKNNTSISEIEVTWPSGTVQTETNLGVDQVINILEIDPPLPVELINFSAVQEEKRVKLSWMTASELDNNHFIIQRSTSNDKRSFKNIGKVKGQGTSNQHSFYFFTDMNPIPGDNYYRLKQLDNDGVFSYSDVEHIKFETKDFSVKIIPNPVNGSTFEIQFENLKNGFATLYDVLGNKILSQTLDTNNRNFIPVTNLANGLYLVNIKGDLINHTSKIVIKH